MHMDRMERIRARTSSLRAELHSRSVGVPQSTSPALPGPEFEKPLPAPRSPPLSIPRNIPEVNPQASTAWLLDRVNQLENENRSAWKGQCSAG